MAGSVEANCAPAYFDEASAPQGDYWRLVVSTKRLEITARQGDLDLFRIINGKRTACEWAEKRHFCAPNGA